MRIKLKLPWFFDEEQVIFGYLSNDRNCDQINLILCAKWYIFQCAKNDKILNIYNFQKKYKSAFAEQFTLLKLKQIKKNVSLKNWFTWEPLFEDI